MIAAEVAAYLAAQGHGLVGTSLFVNWQPDTPDDVTSVYEQSAPLSDDSHSHAVDLVGLQVLVRRTTEAAASAALWAIHRLIVGFGGELESGGSDVTVIFAGSTPAPIGKDERGRAEWSASYIARVQSTGDQFRV